MAPHEKEVICFPSHTGNDPRVRNSRTDFRKRLQPCTSTQILKKLYSLTDNTDDDLSNCILNTSHAFNYLSLKGELGKNKKDFLRRVEAGIKDPANRCSE